jgi:hypothetical protein
MALFDRVRGFGTSDNTIASTAAEDLHSASRPRSDRPAAAAEPEAIARSYYVEARGNERRYYDDYQRKALAIRAGSAAISSRREDLNTVRAMLTMAESRGWTEVRVSGSTTFRRETWIEAEARGLAVVGYKPSDPDRQEAERRRTERERNMPAPRPSPAPRPTEEHRRRGAAAEAELSADGRLILAALSERIDRQMQKLHEGAKVELRAFVAVELAKKERAEGPVVLSTEQRRAATAPEPMQAPSRPAPSPRWEPGAPRRSLAR